MMRGLEEAKEEIEELKNHRKEKVEKNWSRAESQYQGKLPKRTGARGQELHNINVNETFKSVTTLMRASAGVVLGKKELFTLLPDNIEDIDFAEGFQHYVTHRTRRITDFEQLFLLFEQFRYIYGFAAAKLNTKPLGFEPINPWDIWIDEALSFSKIQNINYRLWLTKEELLSRIEDADYGYKNVDGFLGIADKEPSDVLTREKGTQKSMLKKYEILEYWYFEDENWRVKTLGALSGEPITEFRDIEAPNWFGHPFVFGVDLPRFDTIYGMGEADILYENQKAETMLLDLFFQQLVTTSRPPMLYNPDFGGTVADLDPLLNPDQGGLIPIRKEDLGWFQTGSLSPAFLTLVQYLARDSEELTGRVGLSGEPPPPREPGMTTAARLSLSKEALFFKLRMLSGTLKTLGQKVVLSLFEDAPVKEMAEVLTNKGRMRMVVQRGQRTELRIGETPNITSPEVMEKVFTLTIPKSKERALKFQNIDIVPSFLEIKDETKDSRLIEKIRALAEIMRINPQMAQTIIQVINVPKLAVEFFKTDIDVEKFTQAGV